MASRWWLEQRLGDCREDVTAIDVPDVDRELELCGTAGEDARTLVGEHVEPLDTLAS